MYTKRYLYVINILKNVRDPNYDGGDICHACIKYTPPIKQAFVEYTCIQLLEEAYADIVSGKITFPNISNFDTNFVYITKGKSGHISYEKDPIYISDLISIDIDTVEFYANGTIGISDQYVLSKFNDKWYVISIDDYNNSYGQILAEFDGSISDEDMISNASKYLQEHVYLNDAK